jgi:hypothetical protein
MIKITEFDPITDREVDESLTRANGLLGSRAAKLISKSEESLADAIFDPIAAVLADSETKHEKEQTK